MLLHCGLGVFVDVVGVCMLSLFSALNMCFELCREKVFPNTCFAHCLGDWAWYVLVNHWDPYAAFQREFAVVSMLTCLFLWSANSTNFLVSIDVFRLSYSFGEYLNSAFFVPRRNSVAIGPSIPR